VIVYRATLDVPEGTGLVRCETAARRAPEARHTTRKPGGVMFLVGGDGAAVVPRSHHC
jgi:hypothetical protein